MKKFNIKFAYLIIIFLIIPIHSIEAQDKYQNIWNGNIIYEDGIKVIHNPKDPIFGLINLELEEDLCIGETDDADELLWGIKDIAVDEQGNIYVVEMNNYRVKKFDKNGKYLQTIGRFGQGPGEFQLPTIIRIRNDTKQIYIRDYIADIVVFDRLGRFQNKIRLDSVLDDFIPINKDKFITQLQKTSQQNLNIQKVLGENDSQGKTIHTIAEFPFYFLFKGHRVSCSGLEMDLYFSKLDNQSIVYAYSKEYILTVIDTDYKVKYRIKRNASTPHFTPEEKSELRNLKKRGFVPQKDKPYFFSILTDSQGRIYVQRNKALTIMRGRGPIDIYDKEIDVFSREGYFLFKTILPANTQIIQDGYLYSYHVDEDEGMEYVKRYRIKNWDKLPM